MLSKAKTRWFVRVCSWLGVAAMLVILVSCKDHPVTTVNPAAEPCEPAIVTGDIQAGIEKHIAEQTAQHGGYFQRQQEYRNACPGIGHDAAQ